MFPGHYSFDPSFDHTDTRPLLLLSPGSNPEFRSFVTSTPNRAPPRPTAPVLNDRSGGGRRLHPGTTPQRGSKRIHDPVDESSKFRYHRSDYGGQWTPEKKMCHVTVEGKVLVRDLMLSQRVVCLLIIYETQR